MVLTLVDEWFRQYKRSPKRVAPNHKTVQYSFKLLLVIYEKETNTLIGTPLTDNLSSIPIQSPSNLQSQLKNRQHLPGRICGIHGYVASRILHGAGLHVSVELHRRALGPAPVVVVARTGLDAVLEAVGRKEDDVVLGPGVVLAAVVPERPLLVKRLLLAVDVGAVELYILLGDAGRGRRGR